MGGGEDGEGRDHQIGAKRCVRHAVSPRVLGMHTVIIMRNAALLARQTLAHIGQGPLRHEVKAQAQGNAASEVGRGEGGAGGGRGGWVSLQKRTSESVIHTPGRQMFFLE